MEKLLMSFFVAVMLSWGVDMYKIFTKIEITKMKADTMFKKWDWEREEWKEVMKEIKKVNERLDKEDEEYWKPILNKN
jgi:peptidoglycan hydrolase CwlO-like protein